MKSQKILFDERVAAFVTSSSSAATCPPIRLGADQASFNINQLAPRYREREAKASPALKQLLAEQRKLIAEKQLNFLMWPIPGSRN